MPKNVFFEQFCAFFGLKKFFIGFLVFAVEALENCYFWPIFQFLKKKKLKITKITKFQMSLERPIFNIFLHLKRRWKASESYYSNSEKKVFKALANKILTKLFFKFLKYQKF